jgi:hypothetical protein
MNEKEGIGHHDETTIRLARLSLNDGFKLGRIVNWCCNCLHSEG